MELMVLLKCQPVMGWKRLDICRQEVKSQFRENVKTYGRDGDDVHEIYREVNIQLRCIGYYGEVH